jgi:hypothetical protein
MFNETLIREIFARELDLSNQLVNLGALGDVILIILVLIIAIVGFFVKKSRRNNNDDSVSSDVTVQQLDEHIRK